MNGSVASRANVERDACRFAARTPYAGRDGGGVLRPRQDDHRQELGPRVRRAALPRGSASAGGAIVALDVRADRLHARRRRRGEDGEGARVDAAAHEGLGPAPRRGDRARDARGDDPTDHLRRGARSHSRAQRRRTAHRDHLVVAVRGRRAARASTSASTTRSRPARRSTTTAATPASSSSTRTARHKATAIREKAEPRTSTSRRRTRTPTRSPTCRCSKRSGHPVVVNPDRDLARVAIEREWEVRKFVRPVRLRDRMPVPTTAPDDRRRAARLAAFGTGCRALR